MVIGESNPALPDTPACATGLTHTRYRKRLLNTKQLEAVFV